MRTGTNGTEDLQMKRKALYVLVVAAISLAACSEHQEIDVPFADLVLTARTEGSNESKTVVDSETHVYWEPGDKIAVFAGESSGKFETDLTSSSATADFTGTLGSDTWTEGMDIWAVYPYSADAVFDGETIMTTLPSEQVARAGSFGKDMNLAIAHSTTTTLQFYNVGGGIRFSVTEEGIKKVIFEGLNGEIISGTVKVGFENGLPKVQEVSSGSLFITLLPPSGQTTFETNTWYYIVAIPGSLDGGYKLRFYKDDDYARKVSEKKVEIKRSIYGNIEKADQGIEYEAQTTHFPETKEEWEESIALTEEIGDIVANFMDSLAVASLDDFLSIKDMIGRIEGVEDVIMNPEEKSFSIMQKDSIWVNYFVIPTDIDFTPTILSGATTVLNGKQRKKNTNNHFRGISKRTNINPNIDYYVNTKRKALILVPPFKYSFGPDYSIDINFIVQELKRAGFKDDDILIKNEGSIFNSVRSTDILQFKGSQLSNYDFVFLRTHGGTGYRAQKPRGDKIESTTILLSSTRYNKKTVESLVEEGKINWSDVAISSIDEDNNGLLEYYLCMTPSFLDNSQYENACIILTACSSAKILVNGNGGSMIQSFLDKKAGIVSGYTLTTMNTLDIPLSMEMVSLMCNGLSFQDAIKYIQYSDIVTNYSQQEKSFFRKNYRALRYGKDDIVWLTSSVDPMNFHYEPSDSQPYHLLDPYPFLNEVSPNGGICSLSWQCNLVPFEFFWPIMESGHTGWSSEYSTIPLTIHYEVYVDNSMLLDSEYPDDTVNSVSCSRSSGSHNWYVIANIKDGDTVIASYKSEEGHFVVIESGLNDIPGQNL